MSVARLALVLPLLFSAGAALAQAPAAPTKPGAEKRTPEESADVQKRVAEWLKTCLADWDKTTHMTKREWHTTCQRVAAERGRFLVENPSFNVRRR
jgi:hypothetical protein